MKYEPNQCKNKNTLIYFDLIFQLMEDQSFVINNNKNNNNNNITQQQQQQ